MIDLRFNPPVSEVVETRQTEDEKRSRSIWSGRQGPAIKALIAIMEKLEQAVGQESPVTKQYRSHPRT